MVQLRYVLNEILHRLRGTRAAAFLPCQSPPPAPAPSCPRPPRLPQKQPIRLPPLPPVSLPPAPLPPALPPLPLTTPPLSAIYPRESTTWGLDGGWAPTTQGYETRVYEPPRQTRKADPQVLAFSVFDGLFDD